MLLPQLAAGMGGLFLVSELGLSLVRRSARAGATAARGGSHRWLWAIIAVAITAGWICAGRGVGPRIASGDARALAVLAAVVFAGGSGLRWWAIRVLGRFFTVDVATVAGQRVVEEGPYRWVRHPSYTGLLLQFAGWALTLNHGVSWLVIFLPVTAALLYRMGREEAVLGEHLGEPYAAYRRRTRRLLPGIY